MTPETVYREYVAIKAHFNRVDYDYFRYNGQLNFETEQALAFRTDVFHFSKLAEHYDPKGLLVAHLVENPSTWIGDIVSNIEPYVRRRAIIDSLQTKFAKDIETFDGNLDDALRPKKFMLPGLVQMYLAKRITLETATILNDLTGVTDLWRKKCDPAVVSIIGSICLRWQKYLPFLVLMTKGGYKSADYFKICTRPLDRGRLLLT